MREKHYPSYKGMQTASYLIWTYLFPSNFVLVSYFSVNRYSKHGKRGFLLKLNLTTDGDAAKKATLFKKTPTQVFSCENLENF